MKRFKTTVGLALVALGFVAFAGLYAQPPLTPAPAPEQKNPPPLPAPNGGVHWEEKKVLPPQTPLPKTEERKPLQDPTDPRLDPRLNELLNPTRVVATKQVPIAIRGRVVTPTGASVLLDFGGKMVMLRKGTNVSLTTADGAATFRVVDITENEVLLETPTKELLSIR